MDVVRDERLSELEMGLSEERRAAPPGTYL